MKKTEPVVSIAVIVSLIIGFVIGSKFEHQSDTSKVEEVVDMFVAHSSAYHVEGEVDPVLNDDFWRTYSRILDSVKYRH